MAEWVRANNEPITVISPYVLGMGRQDRQSRPLLADDIIRAIFRIVAPTGTVPRTAEARAAKLHALLAESARLGRRHVLLIEEAHDLSTQTLKHLKRFYELRDGFQTLLAIILIGQTELEQRLSEQDASVREVVQRMAIVHLPAIDNHIADYLRHKFARVDLDYAHFITPDAIDEIRNRLRTSATRGSGVQRQVSTVSLCHPLVINNLVSAAMNEAVKIGAPKVTGALIAAVARAE
jgi:type II secretory pathway predicted ATPase ExeA